MTSSPATIYPPVSARAGRSRRGRPGLVHAREHRHGYTPTPDGSAPDTPAPDTPVPAVCDGSGGLGGAEVSGGVLAGAVAAVEAAVGRLACLVEDPRVASGQLEALVGLVKVLDRGQATAVALTGRVEQQGVCQTSAGLPLEGLLALSTRLPFTERRQLVRLAETLGGMPFLAAAWRAGIVSHGQVRAIVAETRTLDAAARRFLDSGFADHDRVARFDADQLLDTVRDAVARMRPDLADTATLRTVERRFVSLQPGFDGAMTGYFELDPESAAIFQEALDAASPAPTTDRDHTRNAHTHPTADVEDEDESGWRAGRSRARQRADGLVALAEGWLAGHHRDGQTRRARPRMYVWADLATLTGDDTTGHTARLLWRSIGGPVSLTPAATRRLASDADLQTILHDNGHILGVTAPTATIPARVRAAVHARDHGCRFPGCTAPIHHCDLHHIHAREHDGPTTIDNLVAVCRRHHTAITQGRWNLTMTNDAVVTVRRGARTATSDPPHRRQLYDQPPPRSTPPPRTPTPTGTDVRARTGTDPP